VPNIDGWTGWKENGGSGGVGRKGGYLSGPLNAFGSQRLVAADHILVDVVRHARRVLQMVGHARSRIRECPFWKKRFLFHFFTIKNFVEKWSLSLYSFTGVKMLLAVEAGLDLMPPAELLNDDGPLLSFKPFVSDWTLCSRNVLFLNTKQIL
jgi:hypothetical protein